MILRISELKLPPDHSREELEREIRRALRIQEKNIEYEIMRRSIDARKKPELSYVYTIDVTVKNPRGVLKKIRNKKVSLVDKKEYVFPYHLDSPGREALRPVIVGSGPAGLFCGLMLARAGLKPIILERGECVERRMETVNHFWATGTLNEQSNVQFGEGGAGTFSDGKLNTLIKDPTGRIRFVLKEFVKAGASPQILYHHKPHVGTDVLVDVVKHIREEIRALGGEIRFESCLTGISRHTPEHMTSPVYDLEINHRPQALQTNALVLAIGHSARDTFQMLLDLGLTMQPKSFAVGLRMEHSQQTINAAMYGENCPYDLGAAAYKVTHKCSDGRGVYSFCMCPGGYVVNASSEKGRTAVNGMSYSSRSSANANSAIVVTVTPEDYGTHHVLAGVEFQRGLEERAYTCGDGKIPVQRLEDFIENRPTSTPGKLLPQTKGQYQMTNLRGILPEFLNQDIIEGVSAFGKKIPGFFDGDSLFLGVESRTSSPVRILRNESGQSDSHPGIFPCGEGAGYAGGITSAAVDGIRTAEQVCGSFTVPVF